MTDLRSLMRSMIVSAILFFPLLIAACDESTSPATEISISITQPTDSAVVQDSVLRVLAEITTNCGCQAYVEFHIDGVHQYSDYLPFFSYDWDIREKHGLHTIQTRVVVPGRGFAWDSVRVFINPQDSLRGGTITQK